MSSKLRKKNSKKKISSLHKSANCEPSFRGDELNLFRRHSRSRLPWFSPPRPTPHLSTRHLCVSVMLLSRLTKNIIGFVCPTVVWQQLSKSFRLAKTFPNSFLPCSASSRWLLNWSFELELSEVNPYLLQLSQMVCWCFASNCKMERIGHRLECMDDLWRENPQANDLEMTLRATIWFCIYIWLTSDYVISS